MTQIKTYKAIGVMSGTSLDGIDVLACTFTNKNGCWSFDIFQGETFDFSIEMFQRLKRSQRLNGYDLSVLNNDYGALIGKVVCDFMHKHNFIPDFIASHGYTVFHEPSNKLTLQIGSGAVIAAQTGITTVCDFRTTDVALSGNGAPLVPIGDKLLFSNYGACLNLGGFSNISFDREGCRVAFDICPVNFVLNHYAEKLGKRFDKGGEIARSGKVNNELLDKLNKLDYYKQSAPKSLGREFVEQIIYPLVSDELVIANVIRTFTEHVAIQISKVINDLPITEVLITGGGAFNSFLIELLVEKSTSKIIVPSASLVDFKEALLFGFLGVLRLNNTPNCLASATGAIQDSVGGAIFTI